MNFIKNLFSKAAAEPIEAVGNVLDGLFTSDDERLTHEEVRIRLAQRPSLAQSEINKVQAQHRSIFVAGGRPFIMWVCGAGLGYVWVIRPIIMDIATALEKTVQFAPMDTANMIDLVIALLGLGALRTVEKMNGRTK